MKKIVYFVLLISLAFGAYLLMRETPILVDIHAVSRGEFVQTHRSEGIVRAREKKIIYALSDGNMDSLPLRVGDWVRRGQVLTTLHGDREIFVRSPFAGIVSQVFRDSQGPIRRGESIVEISSLDRLEIVAEVLTPKAVRLQRGGLVRIFNWGGGVDLEGRISEISRAGKVKVSALGVEELRTEVRVELVKPPAQATGSLGDQFHVDLEFVVLKKSNELLIPVSALMKAGEDWLVYRVTEGRAQKVKIKLGEVSDRVAIIVEGLNVGEAVIDFPSDKIQEGTLVAPK